MRKLTTSLSFFSLLIPATGFAQDAPVTAPPAADAAEAPAEDAPAAEPTTEEAPVEAAPAVQEPVAEEPAAEAGASASLGASTDTGLTGATTAAAPPPPPPEADAPKRNSSARQTGPADNDKWEMSYSGYFRAPMKIGIADNSGPQHIAAGGRDANGELVNPDGRVIAHDPDNPGQEVLLPRKITLHRPVIPDDQYGSWQSTAHNKSDWAEMFFSVGNGTVSGTLAIQGFQFTDSAWALPGAQFGIGQGWIEIDHDLGFENVKFNVKVGSHWARYGMAGIYDAGEYDTYLFGRTHTVGGTGRADLSLSTFDLAFEGGFGAKQPDPKMYNRARFTTMGHGHVFFTLPSVEVGAHLMHAWSAQEVVPTYPNVQPGSSGCDWDAANGARAGTQCTTSTNLAADGSAQEGGIVTTAESDFWYGTKGEQGVYGPEYPNGTQTIMGLDIRADLGLLGYLYAGYSYQMLKNGLVVDNAIESIHSFGGGMYSMGITDNYLETPFCTDAAPNDSCSNGTGSVGTAMLQYELGLANFGIMPGSMDFKTKLYGMLNHVGVDDVEVENLVALWGDTPGDGSVTIDEMRQDGAIKLKFGVDGEFFPLEWMSAGLRFDRLNPNSKMQAIGAEHGFSILTPRITFRSKMVTHEQISLSYSRYFYDQRMCQDSAGNVASPADDPFRPGSIYGSEIAQNTIPSADSGLPLRMYCTQPPTAPVPPSGFGSHSNSQDPGLRGAPTLLPDENVVKLEASMWW
jgi:hypothetical protein